jgi:hypothetical protein
VYQHPTRIALFSPDREPALNLNLPIARQRRNCGDDLLPVCNSIDERIDRVRRRRWKYERSSIQDDGQAAHHAWQATQ